MPPIVNSIFFFLALLVHANYGHSQYCTTVGPTADDWSNVESVNITGESGSFISYTGCPGVIGLEDLSLTESVDLLGNGTYTISIQFGTCDNNWPGGGEVWIDFDGSQTFDLNESIGTWQGTPPVALSVFNFTVPSTCINGPVRMRVAQIEDVTPPLNPCSTFTWGSIVDFTVNLSGGSGGTIISYCTGVGPSNTADSNLSSLSLIGEGGTSISFTGCPGVIGLQDLTTTFSVNLGKNISYAMDLIFGTCGGNYNGAGEGWIDYNQNGVFEVTESIGTWQGIPPGGATIFNFTVPGTAIDGPTRMRVVHQEGGILPLDPCATFAWGSTTDFEVVIGVGQDCSGYVGDNMLDPRIVVSLPFYENHNNSVCYTNNVPVYNSPDVFYRLVLADYNADYINVSLCGSTFDTYLQILDKDSSVISSNDDYLVCAPQSELTFSAGLYDTVYVVVQGWSNLKGAYTININDGDLVNLNELHQDLLIYPNPTNGLIFISGLSEPTPVQIRDLKGALVLSEYMQPSGSINTSSLESGIYIIELFKENTFYQTKLVVRE